MELTERRKNVFAGSRWNAGLNSPSAARKALGMLMLHYSNCKELQLYTYNPSFPSTAVSQCNSASLWSNSSFMAIRICGSLLPSLHKWLLSSFILRNYPQLVTQPHFICHWGEAVTDTWACPQQPQTRTYRAGPMHLSNYSNSPLPLLHTESQSSFCLQTCLLIRHLILFMHREEIYNSFIGIKNDTKERVKFQIQQ